MGATTGKQRIVTASLSNTGYVNATNVVILLPQIDWISIVSPSVPITIAPGETYPITLKLYPLDGTQLGNYGGKNLSYLKKL